MSESADRFVVVLGSETAHCCFRASVIDAQTPTLDGDGKPYGRFEVVCECFEVKDAEQIAFALNSVPKQSPVSSEPQQPNE